MTSYLKSMRALFEESEFSSRRKSVQRVMIFASVYMWFGVGLDLMVYPHYVKEFFFYRLIASMLLLLGWFFVRRIKDSLVLSIVTHCLILIPVFTIELMIYETRDPASSYYGGINIVLVGAALLLRWRLRDSLINTIICVGSFFLLMSISDLSYRGSLVPSHFVMVTGAIAVLATYFYDASRFREFCLLKEIQDTNQQLRAVDETKTRFFANISHELRTPLTLILGPLENLRLHKKYQTDNLLIEHLDMMEDNAMRLLRLINDILDLVKLDSDESPPRPELIDMEDFINGKTLNLRPIASLKNVRFSSQCHLVDQKEVWLDRDRLEKIVLNLAVNAIKFTPSGGIVTISVKTENEQLILKVSDTGVGMDEEEMANVFVRFWQSDMSAKSKHRGAGIGLALVKSLTESMNGNVFVESKENEGTVFTVVIPVKMPDEEVPVARRIIGGDVLEVYNEKAKYRGVIEASSSFLTSGSLAKEKISDGGDVTRKRILIADDEDSMRSYIALQLKDYEVLLARDGREAMELAKESSPDLMILDYMMPEMDGVELTVKLRSLSHTSRIPIIMITAQAGDDARMMALEAGVNDFLTKPFSSVELVARVRNLLAHNEFETKLAEKNVYLQAAYTQLKEQGDVLARAEKLSSLGRMSAGIIHEINNPLNYTQTALYALKSFAGKLDESEVEDYCEVLDDAREGVERVVKIVKGLRSFTRGDVSAMGEVNVSKVIEDARKLSGSVMEEITFTSDISDTWVVEGNEIQLCQLFVNMFQNALRAIQIHHDDRTMGVISVLAEPGEKQELVVKIKDNGCGINQEDIDRIFDPFFTKNDVGEGMGLGLSITYKILEQHKARIEVRSEVGKFTEFKIYFSQARKLES